MTQPIICDCDPGHDDAIALIAAFAQPELDVLAVTTSAGNQTQAKTLNNALRILTLMGQTQVEVAEGASKPLERELIIADNVHGESGIEGPQLPDPGFEPVSQSALQLMINKLEQAREAITLVPTGPLTNIASLLSQRPDLKNKIKQIVLMGGAADAGNWTPAAEFNIYVDPEAADIVFNSGLPIVMAGLDVTHKAYITEDDIQAIRDVNNPVATCVAELLEYFVIYHKDPKWGLKGAPLHDPCTIAWLVKPELFTSLDCWVGIETQGEFTQGMTVVDRYHLSGKPKNAKVLLDIDRQGFVNWLINSLRHYTR